MINLLSLSDRRAAIGRLAVCVLSMLICACSEPDVTSPALTPIVRIGKNSLYPEDVARALPAGLSPDDSTKFVKAFIAKWTDENLVNEIASKQVDIEQIDKMVEEYRRELILREYTDRMFRQNSGQVSEDSVAAYYAAHTDDYKLSQPMVKGTYIKVDSAASNIRKIRRLYSSSKPSDADLLEKEIVSEAIHYDYFRDNWIPWEQLESKIPYNFGTNSHQWPHAGRTLDFTQNGMTYLLYISECLPEGSPMPLEAARADIRTRLLNANRTIYQQHLLRQMLQTAIDNGNAEVNI